MEIIGSIDNIGVPDTNLLIIDNEKEVLEQKNK
jgi:hypothetical protein